jgi:hypothetical protein
MEILYPNQSNFKSKVPNVIKKFNNQFFEKKNPLLNEKIENVINTFDEISKYWVSENFKLKNIFIENSLGFIIPWLQKKNSINLLNLNFNDYRLLDIPTIYSNKKIPMFARPQGTALHWLAGNVPVISLISLFQGLLTKNKNIIKVSKSFKTLFPIIFLDLKTNFKIKKNLTSTLKNILESILIIYVDHNDISNLEYLSIKSDIRVIWGGSEAVKKISGLKKKINCKDIIFGPKVSMAYISKEKLKNEQDLKNFSELFVNDVFNFDQLGCNSPHNLFIERGSKFNLTEISKIIAQTFNRRKINSETDPVNKYNLLVKNFTHSLKKNNISFSGKNYDWNIFINDDIKVHDPIYNRSIFLSSISNLQQLSKILPDNTQSIGLYVEKVEKLKIVSKLSEKGVDRFPNIGTMSIYTNPWDGYLPMQNMIRWVSY